MHLFNMKMAGKDKLHCHFINTRQRNKTLQLHKSENQIGFQTFPLGSNFIFVFPLLNGSDLRVFLIGFLCKMMQNKK